jgi:hypothetical protein
MENTPEESGWEYFGEGRNHVVFRDGEGKALRIKKVEVSEKVRLYEDVFRQTILQSSDLLRPFIPEYHGEYEISEGF